ncbi:MAG: Gfo/Idh/MocA family oxidoreductase [Verrucomicrobia bacterium]|nr:Gfo/Idh/MocA family oxidoreductase [Verrucomicrobiota bacterium]
MNPDDFSQFSRRDFLNSSASGVALAMAGGAVMELTPQALGQAQETPKNDSTPPVNIGVIGCGVWGRELLKTLATIPSAPVVAVSDTYPAYLRRGLRGAPKAKGYRSHTELLADENVQAVVIATPTHQHRECVQAALEAGKHVYCEAPMAHTIDDARAIGNAAETAPKLNFQVGLQTRSDPQRHFLIEFIRTGAMGKNALAKGQWHKKTSWRRVSPNTERQKELNWRLDRERSLGLIGEIGVHQVDALGWFMNERPVAVNGFGSIIQWDDGRNVPDTIQAVFDHPSGARTMYDCTLANSFDGSYDLIYGSYAALMMRGARAWMFKEADSPLLGWEVYAKKNSFFGETGIALVANATKLTNQNEDPHKDPEGTKPSRFHALEAFAKNCHKHQVAVEDFEALFGDDDPGALTGHLAETNKHKLPYATHQDGFESVVIAAKANEAILTGKRIEWSESEYHL